MSRTYKVGVIGVGGIAKTHMPGWNASGITEVVAACDIDRAAVEKFGAEWKVPDLATDAADLFRNPDIDIIDVCTPNNYHAPLSIAAMEAGKHVICEKPLAPNPAQIRDMIAARDRSGKLLMTAQHFRFRGASKAMKAEIDSGTLGDIYHARSWMLRRAAAPNRPGFIMKKHSQRRAVHRHRRAHPRPDPLVHGQSRAAFRHRRGAGRAGAPAGRLHEHLGAGRSRQEFDVEDFAAAFVRFENGATLVLEVSWLLHHDTAGRRHADVALRHAGRVALAQVRDLPVQLRHAAAVQLHAEAHGRHAGAARAGVRRVRQGRR